MGEEDRNVNIMDMLSWETEVSMATVTTPP